MGIGAIIAAITGAIVGTAGLISKGVASKRERQKNNRAAAALKDAVISMRSKLEEKQRESARILGEYKGALERSGGRFTEEVQTAANRYKDSVSDIDSFEASMLTGLDDLISTQSTTMQRLLKGQMEQGTLEIHNKFAAGIETLRNTLKSMKEQSGYAQKGLRRQMSKEDVAVEREFKKTEEELNVAKDEARKSKRQLTSAAKRRGLGFSTFLAQGITEIGRQLGKTTTKLKELNTYRLGEIDNRKAQIEQRMAEINSAYQQGAQNVASQQAQLYRNTQEQKSRLRLGLAQTQAQQEQALGQFAFGERKAITGATLGQRLGVRGVQAQEEQAAIGRRTQAEQFAQSQFNQQQALNQQAVDALQAEILQSNILGAELSADKETSRKRKTAGRVVGGILTGGLSELFQIK